MRTNIIDMRTHPGMVFGCVGEMGNLKDVRTAIEDHPHGGALGVSAAYCGKLSAICGVPVATQSHQGRSIGALAWGPHP